MGKRELSEIELKKILILYKNKESIREIARIIDASATFITSTLAKEGIFNKNGLKFSSRFITNKKYKAICKKTNKEFEDYLNKSGALTSHITALYPDLVLESQYKLKQCELKSGRFWYEKYFNIVENNKIIEFIKCKYCDWTTTDLNNVSGCYTTHITKTHNKDLQIHLAEFPDDEDKFQAFVLKREEEKYLLSSPQNHIACGICGEKMRKITNTHLISHNISIADYKMRFGSTLSNTSLSIVQDIYNKNLKMHENNFVSKGQLEISEFVRSLGFNCKDNDRKELQGKELDIYIPEKRYAIEFNGNYWHSEFYGKDQSYHLNKTILAANNNIQLIQIFEDEWTYKSKVCEHIIQSHLRNEKGVNIISITSLSVRQITESEAKIFLNKNHIQDFNTQADIHIGAFLGEELVSVMTFKYNTASSQLAQFAVKLKYRISGVSTELLNFFIENYETSSIVGFADRRWTVNVDDNFYTKLGFKFNSTIEPDYTYFNPVTSRVDRLSKLDFNQEQIKLKYPEYYNESETEWKMLSGLGFGRIWDCGKIKFVL